MQLIAAYSQDGNHKGFMTERLSLTENPKKALRFVTEKGAKDEIERLRLESVTGWKDYIWVVEPEATQQVVGTNIGTANGQTVADAVAPVPAQTTVDTAPIESVSSDTPVQEPAETLTAEEIVEAGSSAPTVADVAPVVDTPIADVVPINASIVPATAPKVKRSRKTKAARGPVDDTVPLDPPARPKRKRAARALTPGRTPSERRRNAIAEVKRRARKTKKLEKKQLKRNTDPKRKIKRLVAKAARKRALAAKRAKREASRTTRLVSERCLCGCNKRVAKGKYFLRGHIAKFRSKLTAIAEGLQKPVAAFGQSSAKRLGPWKKTRLGGVRPSKSYKVLRAPLKKRVRTKR